MEIARNWLETFIQLEENNSIISDKITQTGLEVEHTHPFSFLDQGLIIGEVKTCSQHPNAERLKTTTVDIGAGEVLSIVCGASNVAAGQKVIVAPVGITLHTFQGEALKIKKAKIRGEISQGMICAEDEIGLGPLHDNIIVLDTNLPAGTPVEDYFQTPRDTIFSIDITPNRGDACSHLGVARELSAIFQRPLILPETTTPTLEGDPLPISVDVLDYNACPRYCGIVLQGLTVKPSPIWLQNRLKSIGLQSINNIVDVTNFVLHELGQPLHAFDYDQIVGHHIIVTSVEKGTRFITLDQKERKLDGSELMICDEEGPMCMAGIFGGTRAEIQNKTTSIFLESAYFSPEGIAITTNKHNISTDASFRYERGTDPNLVLIALQRAVDLIIQVAGGRVASNLIDHYPDEILPTPVQMTYTRIRELIGAILPIETIHSILEGLGIMVTEKNDNGFVAMVPPYRNDVTREADVIEEILRIYGYNKIPLTGKLSSNYLADIDLTTSNHLQEKVANLLVDNGYYEIITNSFTKQSLNLAAGFEKDQNVPILNPLSESFDTLRQGLLFSGLEVIGHNLNRGQKNVKVFEFGKTYSLEEGKYVERRHLGIWITGHRNDLHWSTTDIPLSLHDLRNAIHKIEQQLGIDATIREEDSLPIYIRTLISSIQDKDWMTLGEVQPKLCQMMEIHQPVFFANINWEVLKEQTNPIQKYRPVSKFPAVKRDLSLIIDKNVRFFTIQKLVEKQKENLLKQLSLVNIYDGDRIAHGKKTYTLSFLLQSPHKTLKEKEIDKVMQRLMKLFEQELGALINR